SEEARKATLAVVENGKPIYMRVARDKTPIMSTKETPFELGKANVLFRKEGARCAIFATGPLLYQTLVAAHQLEAENIPVSVTNIHTIKPIDRETIVRE